MAPAGNIYERELKNILTGDPKTLDKITKTCSEEEKRDYDSLRDNPFVMIRAAGSLGMDLVALRWDCSFPIEVKSSIDETLHFSRNPRLMEQASKMKEECMRAHLLPVYAFRLKRCRGDPWRIFALPTEQLKGSMRLVQGQVPEIELNDKNHYIMKWCKGIKLSRFVSYLNAKSESQTVVQQPEELGFDEFIEPLETEESIELTEDIGNEAPLFMLPQSKKSSEEEKRE